jgi:hypothetical protein
VILHNPNPLCRIPQMAAERDETDSEKISNFFRRLNAEHKGENDSSFHLGEIERNIYRRWGRFFLKMKEIKKQREHNDKPTP